MQGKTGLNNGKTEDTLKHSKKQAIPMEKVFESFLNLYEVTPQGPYLKGKREKGKTFAYLYE